MENRRYSQNPWSTVSAVIKAWLKFFMFLFGFACVATFGWWLYCQHEDEVGHREWARVKSELEAKGEKLDWASFVPDPLPDDLNFMRTPFMEGILYRESPDPNRIRRLESRNAGSLTSFLKRPDTALAVNWKGIADTFRSNSWSEVPGPSTNPAAMVVEWMRPLENDFAELRVAATRPYSQLRFSVTNAYEPYRPNYGALRRLAQQLAVLAAAELTDGDPQLAIDDLRVNFAISRGLEDQGSLVGFMIAVAIDGLTVGPVSQGLVERRWSDQQLVELDKILVRVDLPGSYPGMIRAERAAANQSFENWVAPVIVSSGSTGARSPWFLDQKYRRLQPNGWLLCSKATFDEIMQDEVLPLYDENLRIVRKNGLTQLNERLNKLADSHYARDRFALIAIPNLWRAIEIIAKTQTMINEARVALAIERRRLKTGQVPASLAELAPEFIDTLPHDLLGGEPLRYRRVTDDRYLLWSVGWNEVDEDGKARDGREVGDWVWFGF